MRVTRISRAFLWAVIAMLFLPPPAAAEGIPVVRPEVIMEITDISGDFFFQRPRRIRETPDGNVLVQDRDKLLHFAPEGTFVRDYFKKGEGPGELRGITDFFFLGDKVVMGGYMPLTLLVKSLADGSVIREHRDSESNVFASLIYLDPQRYLVQTNEISFAELKNGLNQAVNRVFYYDHDHTRTDPGLEFTTLNAVIKRSSEEGNMVAINDITSLERTFDPGRYGYFAHTKRYLVKQLDLEKQEIIREFSRPYEPVPFIEEDTDEEIDRELAEQVKRKFFKDIQGLAMQGSDLLVFTSTLDADKGVLVDVYNDEGKFQGSFYLALPGLERPDDIDRKPLCFGKDYLWTTTLDEDENPVLVKMKFKR